MVCKIQFRTKTYVTDTMRINLSLFCLHSLIVVAMFEVDVSSKLFLEEKLLVTSWLLEKLGMQRHLQFEMSQYEPKLLEFIRASEGLRHLFEEDDGRVQVKQVFFNFNFSVHALGASGYVFLVTAAIILNEIHEEKVAWIAGASFFMFTCFGYLTGTYVPIFSIFKAWLLLWNPFLREPHFLEKLQEVGAGGGGEGGDRCGCLYVSLCVCAGCQRLLHSTSRRGGDGHRPPPSTHT